MAKSRRRWQNPWVDGNEPIITVYSDWIEILSRGGLAPLQTKAGFFRGHSVPVNEKLSEIFLQLHISEKREEEFLLFRLNTEKGRLTSPTTTSPSPFHSTSSTRWVIKWVIKLKSTDSMTHKQEYWLKSGITQILRKGTGYCLPSRQDVH